MFGINITWIYVHISLLDDIYLEFEEFFHGVLTTSDPAVILDPDEATVIIQHDDSMLISIEEFRTIASGLTQTQVLEIS